MADLLPSIRAVLAEGAARPPLDPTADVSMLRAGADAGVIDLHRHVRSSERVRVRDLTVPGPAGDIPVRLYIPGTLVSSEPGEPGDPGEPEERGALGDASEVATELSEVSQAAPLPVPVPVPVPMSVHIHLHGGGWWMGSIATVDPMCRELADRLDMAVLSVDYRLTPEHPFPAGLDDVVAVVRWVETHPDDLGFDVASLSLGGESAGANLAAAAALRMRDDGGSSLVGLWLDVPAVDLTMPTTPSLEAFGTGYGLEVALFGLLDAWYLPGTSADDPLVSPQFADLAGLPPVLVTTAEYDPIRDQGETFAQTLREHGVDVWSSRHEGHIHGSSWLTALEGDDPAWYAGVIDRVKALHTR